MKRSFVYRWIDNLTGKLYIGVHKGSEDDGYVCSSKPFLKEYNQRAHDFTREILAWFDDYKEAREHEIQLLTEVDAKSNLAYYNKSNGDCASFYSEGPLSEETKTKISEANKGKIVSEETRVRLSLSHLGHSPSLETRIKLSHSSRTRIRKPHSKEAKEKMRMAKLGRKNDPPSEETRRKISEANKGNKSWTGKSLSDEHKAKVSIALKGKCLSSEQKMKMKGRIFTDEHRLKLSLAKRNREMPMEQRAKISNSLKIHWEKQQSLNINEITGVSNG